MNKLISNMLNKLDFKLTLNGPPVIFMTVTIGFILCMAFVYIVFSETVAYTLIATLVSIAFVILSAPAIKYMEMTEFAPLEIPVAWAISLFGTIVFIVAMIIIYIRIGGKYEEDVRTAIFPGMIYFMTSWSLSSGYWLYREGNFLSAK